MVSVESRPALKVAITGIDGAGKSSTITSIVNELAVDNTIIHTASRPVYSIVGRQKRYHYRHLIGLIDKLHGAADKSQNPNLVCAVNVTHVILQGRMIEPSLIRKVQPTLVLGARDLLVDPSVYAIFYSPRLAAKSMPERIDLLSNLTGAHVRDIIFFLTVSPQEAVRRIEVRIEGEKGSLTPVERAKWRHLHENPDDLEKLQREYYVALDELHKRAHVDIVEIDTTTMTQNEVGDFIKARIKSHRANKNPSESPTLAVA